MSGETLTRVGDYTVLGVLGAGGMGKVYKVRNVITDRVEAMKVVLPDLADQRVPAGRFLREIKLLAGLNHPNIASLRTALTWDNQLVMIMEYVEGVTLAARLKEGPLSSAEAVACICQVLSALSYAHGLHIIHRDIKPANMMLTPEGVVKLMDFGIARAQSDPVLTKSGSTLGSVQYMAPEQLKGEPADERSDLYSVGVSLYEMVTGLRPFHADNEFAVMAAHLQKAPAPPSTLLHDLPPGLNEIILMAMEKDPAQRFQSADAFRNALQSLPVSALGQVVQEAAPTREYDSTGTVATPHTPMLRAVMRGATEEEPAPSLRAAETTPVAESAVPQRSTPAQQPSEEQKEVSPAQSQGSAAMQAPTPLTKPQSPSIAQAPGPPSLQQPVVSAGSTPGRTHRGLYIALGSLIVLIVLVAAGLYIPHINHTNASGDRNTVAQPVSPPLPAPSDNSNSPVPNSGNISASSSSPSSGNTPAPLVVPEAPHYGSVNVETKQTHDTGKAFSGNKPAEITNSSKARASARSLPREVPEQQSAATNDALNTEPSSTSSAEQLRQLEHDADLLTSRAEAVDASLDGIRQSQAAQGLGTRGDIVASQQRMRTYVTRAQSALRNRDADGAKKYLELAEAEVTRLEKFLGR